MSGLFAMASISSSQLSEQGDQAVAKDCNSAFMHPLGSMGHYGSLAPRLHGLKGAQSM